MSYFFLPLGICVIFNRTQETTLKFFLHIFAIQTLNIITSSTEYNPNYCNVSPKFFKVNSIKTKNCNMPTEANIHRYHSKNPSSTLPSLRLSCFSESQKANTFCILVAQYCYITQVHSSIFYYFVLLSGASIKK